MVFAVVLGNGERDFSDRDRRVMNTLRPHVAQAWRNVRDHERLRALVGAAQDIASMQGWGVIVLCEPPEELVPGALVSLYRYFGARLRHRRSRPGWSAGWRLRAPSTLSAPASSSPAPCPPTSAGAGTCCVTCRHSEHTPGPSS